MINEKLLKNEERAMLALRSLYCRYGYLPYKMSKFEEYELYLRNKDFLVSDRVITFNDTNGKLMALKPDVTLSIIKNSGDEPGSKQKVYYNENVYRVSDSTRRYKEILQSGLECIGDIDLYDIYEVVSLAAQCLALISDSFVLELSHLGVLSDAMDAICPDADFQQEALRFIAAKNAHDLRRLCRSRGLSEEAAEALTVFITAHGERSRVIEVLEPICGKESLRELRTVSALLDRSPYSDRILLDFSVVNDMSYYNGFVFKGFLDGICDGVLAGGQYDRMMQKMGRSARAIGFAVYLDSLERLGENDRRFDVDTVILYGNESTAEQVAEAVEKLAAEAQSVTALRVRPEKFRCREIWKLSGDRLECVTDYA